MNVEEVRVYYDEHRTPTHVKLVSGGEEIGIEHVVEVSAPIVGSDRRPKVTLTFRCPIRHCYHEDEHPVTFRGRSHENEAPQ